MGIFREQKMPGRPYKVPSFAFLIFGALIILADSSSASGTQPQMNQPAKTGPGGLAPVDPNGKLVKDAFGNGGSHAAASKKDTDADWDDGSTASSYHTPALLCFAFFVITLLGLIVERETALFTNLMSGKPFSEGEPMSANIVSD